MLGVAAPSRTQPPGEGQYTGCFEAAGWAGAKEAPRSPASPGWSPRALGTDGADSQRAQLPEARGRGGVALQRPERQQWHQLPPHVLYVPHLPEPPPASGLGCLSPPLHRRGHRGLMAHRQSQDLNAGSPALSPHLQPPAVLTQEAQRWAEAMNLTAPRGRPPAGPTWGHSLSTW